MYDSALDGPLEQNMLDLPLALQNDGRTGGSGSQRFRSRFVDWLVRLYLFDDLNRRAVHVVASLRLMVHESVAGRPSAVEIAGRDPEILRKDPAGTPCRTERRFGGKCFVLSAARTQWHQRPHPRHRARRCRPAPGRPMICRGCQCPVREVPSRHIRQDPRFCRRMASVCPSARYATFANFAHGTLAGVDNWPRAGWPVP